jgi:hypothetical protein
MRTRASGSPGDSSGQDALLEVGGLCLASDWPETAMPQSTGVPDGWFRRLELLLASFVEPTSWPPRISRDKRSKSSRSGHSTSEGTACAG